jgi:dinuclear metal center YbgI/SA1388 family protein
MSTVSELATWLEDFAPLRLAETWDNVGLLWGDPAAKVERVMTCLTVTKQSTDEAIQENVGLVVTHHPVLFRATKRIRADHPQGSLLWSLARSGVAIYSPHTALDNTVDGINDGLARRVGLVDAGPIRPSPAQGAFKIIVFAPRGDREAVLSAAFAAGAGQIGVYNQCSFSTAGHGTFFGTPDANPTIGEAGRLETVREWKLEMVCPPDRLAAVLKAIRQCHSYEEPAIDVIPLQPQPFGPGIGRVGKLPKPKRLGELATTVATVLDSPATQFGGDPNRIIERVAILCGAGDDLVPDAAREADALLTGELRFHQVLEAESLGLGVILAGHYATERPGVEDLALRIAESFPGVTAWSSRAERDPLRDHIASRTISG